MITGFKSFAEKTTLNFGPGMTAIVGPNGCGKSNVADAFRWVLGEQSAKSLRGQKMADVIFAGAAKRKSLNFAEVSLTFSNEKGVLPIAYEEVTITRRLYRSGECDYFLNSSPVRLKEIHSLLLDSGVGKNAFSIFEQGKIDQVINQSPVERRLIFEEAAGIVRFLTRRQEALKRVEQAQANLARVQDIYLEVKQALHLLEEQARQAKLFQEDQQNLQQVEKIIFVMQCQTGEKKKYQLQQSVHQHKSSLEKLAKEANECLQEEKALQQQLKESEEALQSQKNEYFQLKNLSELKQSERQHCVKRSFELKGLLNKRKTEQQEVTIAKKERLDLINSLVGQIQGLEVKVQDLSTSYADQEQKMQQERQKRENLQQEATQKQQEFVKKMQQEADSTKKLQQLEFSYANYCQKQERLTKNLSQLNKKLLELEGESTLKQSELKQLSTLIDSLKDRFGQVNHFLNQLEEDIELKRKELEELRKENAKTLARQQVLAKMQQEFEGFTLGSKKLLQASLDPKGKIFKKIEPFYKFFHPLPEHTAALALILQNYSHTLVVETVADLKEVIAFSKEESIEDFSLACIELLQMKKVESKDLCFFMEKEQQNILSDYFLTEVKVWPTLMAALESLPVYNGLIVEKGYFDLQGVYFSAAQNQQHLFQRESELKQLSKKSAKQQISLQSLQQSLSLLQQKKAHIKNERIEIDSQLRREEMKLVEVNFTLQRSLNELSKAKKEQAYLQQQALELKALLQNSEESATQERQTHQNKLLQLEQVKIDLKKVEANLNERETIFTSFQQEEKEKRLQLEKVKEQYLQAKHEKQLLEEKNRDAEQKMAFLFNEQQQLAKEEGELLQQAQKQQFEIEQIGEKEKSLKLKEEALAHAKDQFQTYLQEKQKQKFFLQNALREKEISLAQIEAKLEMEQQTLQKLQLEAVERYGTSLKALKAETEGHHQVLEQLEKQRRQLKQKLNEAGSVNLAAMEEVEKKRLREEFLNAQISDLVQTKEELLQMIEQLSQESLKLFQETFSLVRQNFRKNFAILFQGGEADLQLIEASSNPLAAGGEIIAQPPGKQMRSITLLSGGEKCLTSLALLFAIFEVKASPFCILDEIDAPLDDTNIDRFVKMVRHFAQQSQFLIITHNKRTMAESDKIFGVSMEEKGVSKLFSLHFSHEKKCEVGLA